VSVDVADVVVVSVEVEDVLPVEVVVDVLSDEDDVEVVELLWLVADVVVLVWLEVALEVEVAESVVVLELEVVVVDPLAITAVCACSPFPRTVTMYFCPAATG
jgi:hypothetical protein